MGIYGALMRRIVILHYTIWLDLIQYELNRCFNSNNKRPNGFDLSSAATAHHFIFRPSSSVRFSDLLSSQSFKVFSALITHRYQQ